LRRGPRERAGLRERLDVLREGGELEEDAPRVGLVAEQEIDDRRRLQGGEVAAAVGGRAGGDLEEGVEHRPFAGGGGPEGAPQEVDRVRAPLEAAADVEEPP